MNGSRIINNQGSLQAARDIVGIAEHGSRGLLKTKSISLRDYCRIDGNLLHIRKWSKG